MDRSYFLQRLNARAGPRYGVTVNQWTLQDWVKEDFFEGVAPRSQRWTVRSYRSALQVCRLRSKGIKGANETRVHLWLHGASIPFERLRSSLIAEARRMRRMVLRFTSSTYDGGSNKPPSGQTLRGLRQGSHHASPLIHPPGFQWSPEVQAALLGLMRSGASSMSKSEMAHRILSDLGIPEIAEPYASRLAKIFGLGLRGLLGTPNEISESLDEQIGQTTEPDFLRARINLREMRHALKNAEKLLPVVPHQYQNQFSVWVDAAHEIEKASYAKNWASGFLVLALQMRDLKWDELLQHTQPKSADK